MLMWYPNTTMLDMRKTALTVKGSLIVIILSIFKIPIIMGIRTKHKPSIPRKIMQRGQLHPFFDFCINTKIMIEYHAVNSPTLPSHSVSQ